MTVHDLRTRRGDAFLARWFARLAAFVVGGVAGGALSSLVTHVVWPSELPPLGISLLSADAATGAALGIALLCGLSAVVLVAAYQAHRDTD